MAAIAVILINAPGAVSGLAFGAETDWFNLPRFDPPEMLFPIEWTVLIILMGVAAYALWRAGTRCRGVRLGLGCFAIQFVLNLVWTPAFLGLQRPDLDLVVFVALGVAILATIVSFRPVCSLAGWLLVPYLAWVTFAAVSNAVILIG